MTPRKARINRVYRAIAWLIVLVLAGCGANDGEAPGETAAGDAPTVDVVQDSSTANDTTAADTAPIPDSAAPPADGGTDVDTSAPDDSFAPDVTAADTGAQGPCSAIGGPQCECMVSADCTDDGDLCNGTPVCAKSATAHKCVLDPATVIVCSTASDTVCRTSACTAKTGTCTKVNSEPTVACDDGNPCTQADACDGKGQCKGGPNACECESHADCAAKDDDNACNGTLFCDLQALPHTCAVNPKTVISCPASDLPCSANKCAPKTGACELVSLAEGVTCTDGNACTAGDTCDGKGVCSGEAGVCPCQGDADCADKDDGDLCNGISYCDPKTQKCRTNPASVVICQTVDDTACQKTACAPATGKCAVVALPDAATCTDGNDCTHGDGCASGVCAPGTNQCECKLDADCAAKEDGDLCNGTLFCKAGTDGKSRCEVNKGTVKTCPTEGDTTCIHNTCVTKGQGTVCEKLPTGENLACDDGHVCTFARCAAGSCKAVGKVCDCTVDAHCKDIEDGNLCNGTLFCNTQTGKCAVNPTTLVQCAPLDPAGCKKAECLPLSGACTPVDRDDGAPCDDGNVCSKTSACVAGACAVSETTDCDDDNACTDDACDTKVGCTWTANTAPCTDADKCTTNETCSAGKCLAIALDCGDDNPCTADLCAPDTGCGHAPTKATCDDGDACTGDDGCAVGVCVGKPQSCDDGNVCTIDSCDKVDGCLRKPANAACDDGNACSLGDVCQATVCVSGIGKDCDDHNACTLDSCVDGACKHAPAAQDGKTCEDGDLCTAGETCQNGACQGAKPLVCNDEQPCTVDDCDKDKGCLFAKEPDGTACSTPTCASGLHLPARLCHAGKCTVEPVSKRCDDDIICTVDSCDAQKGCSNTPLIGPCEDGNSCTKGDACVGLVCKPGANVCSCTSDAQCESLDDGDFCNGTLRCATNTLPWTCQVAPLTVVKCDASSDTACLRNVCKDKTGECAPAPLPDGATCDADGSECTAKDRCAAGQCQPGPSLACDDGNPCTADTCDTKGGCQHQPASVGCNADDDACTGPDVCLSSKCTAGGKVDCDDDNECTDDACLPLSGCRNTPREGACDDGNKCTTDACTKDANCRPEKSVNCDDANLCTIDACDPKKGCVTSPSPTGSVCDDGDFCTTASTCSSGVCLGAIPRSCADDSGCSVDACDSKAKACTHTARVCADSNACTVDSCIDAPGAQFECVHVPTVGTQSCSGAIPCAGGLRCQLFTAECGRAQAISTLAGRGDAWRSDGVGGDAAFSLPSGVTVDTAGVAWVADSGNNALRRIDAKGAVTTFAGGALPGFADGVGDAAKMLAPRGVAVRSDGLIAVADTGNHRIRLVDAKRAVTTLAGGARGYAGGVGTKAQFDEPAGMTAGPGRVLFVADSGNDRIRRINANGGVALVAGGEAGFKDGTGAAAAFSRPMDVASDGERLFVADTANHAIRRIDVGDIVITIAGDGEAGATSQDQPAGPLGALKARFSGPSGVVVVGDVIVIADTGNSRLRQLGRDGTTLFIAGYPYAGDEDGALDKGRMTEPVGLAVAPDGRLVVTDRALNKVRIVGTNPAPLCSTTAACRTSQCDTKAGYCKTAPTDKADCDDGSACTVGDICATYSCKAGTGQPSCDDKSACTTDACHKDHGCLHAPVARGTACDDGEPCTASTCVLGSCQAPLQVTTVAGSWTVLSADGPRLAAGIESSAGISQHAGEVWFTDDKAHRVRIIGKDDRVVTVAGGTQGRSDGVGTAARFNAPTGILLTADGDAIVADTLNQQLRLVARDGTTTTLAGDGLGGTIDGLAHHARFDGPGPLALHGATIYVGDTVGRRIRRVAAGQVVTLAGSGSTQRKDGVGTLASFTTVSALAAGPDGVLYVGDGTTIRRIGIDRVVTTLVGSTVNKVANGSRATATFSAVTGLVHDGVAGGKGTLWLIDGPGTVRVLSERGEVSTVAGSTIGYADGLDTKARFSGLTALALGDEGMVLLADAGNRRLRRLGKADNACDDGNPCTADTCGTDGKCGSAPRSGSCPAVAACQSAGVCDAGTCKAGPPRLFRSTIDDGGTEAVTAIAADPTGGLVAVGRSAPSGGFSSARIWRLNALGERTKSLGLPTARDTLIDIEPLASGWLAAGMTGPNAAAGAGRLQLVKLGSDAAITSTTSHAAPAEFAAYALAVSGDRAAVCGGSANDKHTVVILKPDLGVQASINLPGYRVNKPEGACDLGLFADRVVVSGQMPPADGSAPSNHYRSTTVALDFTGKELWRFRHPDDTGNYTAVAPSGARTLVYTRKYNNGSWTLSAFEADGTPRFVRENGNWYGHADAPLVAMPGGGALVMTGTIIAMDADGGQLWAQGTNSYACSNVSRNAGALLVDGRVVYGGDAGGNGCLDWTDGLGNHTCAQSGGCSGAAFDACGKPSTCQGMACASGQCKNSNVFGHCGDFGSAVCNSTSCETRFARSVVAGARHTCAIDQQYAVWCWGDNARGQLGNGAFGGYSPVPVKVKGVTARELVLGGAFTCAMDAVGTMLCWGDNTRGQLGIGAASSSPQLTPTAVKGFTGVSDSSTNSVLAGREHVCARKGGEVWCWGDSTYGQAGAASGIVATPTKLAQSIGNKIGVRLVGADHTCFVLYGKQTSCLGRNDKLQLGRTTTGAFDNVLLTKPSGFEPKWYGNPGAAGPTHNCVLADSGPLMCWGDNSHGAFGTPLVAKETATATEWLPPVGTGVVISNVVAGRDFTCVLSSAREVWCFGEQARGALGNGKTSPQPFVAMARVPGLPTSNSGSSVTAITAGEQHVCALDSVGAVRCWGRNDGGQLGRGTTVDSGDAVLASGTAVQFLP